MQSLLLSIAFAAILAAPVSALAAGKEKAVAMPDFTKGDKPGEAHDWTLGPTGARGWIYTGTGTRGRRGRFS